MGRKGLEANVRLNLMLGKLEEGYELYTWTTRYCNIFSLALKLLNMKTFDTGTLQLDRKHTPQVIKRGGKKEQQLPYYQKAL